ncbi:hypothetical protein FE257_008740 [Aspergillus nanangensis]|uniref:Zn(2)-C6 fungal-type domain-containing protein n=1 Tax=Aspergillus nanangensis TaxID=2582783 RepID=A0AAD4CL95_ASPNN|nr:hypothetical protein FE257_008740 [Aspergillus nanangensis]
MDSTSACDRCHAIKARCLRSNIFAGCRRCFRLQHKCSYARTRGLPGRKRKQCDVGVSTPVKKRGYPWVKVQSEIPKEIHRRPEKERPGANPQVPHLNLNPSSALATLDALLEADEMTNFYAVTSSFASRLKATVRANLYIGPPLLRDLYMALMRNFSKPATEHAVYDTADLSLGALGLQVLRRTKINDQTSLASFLWLGLFLMTFDRLILGTSTYLICENTLLQLYQCYPWASRDPKMSDAVICLLFTDTITCLLNCRGPIIRFEPPRSGMVDRYAGLCCELLPMLYDTCTLATSNRSSTDACSSSLDLVVWGEVYQRVYQWQPQCAQTMLNELASNELAVLLAQAHAYRAAVLLVLYRIRYPLEKHQTETQIWCTDEILSQMGSCLALVGEPPPHTVMPLFIGALELKDSEKRTRALLILRFCRGSKKYRYMALLEKMCHEFWSQESPDWLTFLRRYYPLNIPL